MRKSGEACCYVLGYKMSLRKAVKDFEKTMNGKSCVSCKDGPHTCLLSSNCATLFVLLIKSLKSLADSR